MNVHETLLIAHRGEPFDAPENTLASIQLAWGRKAKAVEVDIHLTNDNEIVVIHDFDTLRISGTKKVIKNSTLAELRLLDFGSFKDAKWNKERIPTLIEVLKTVPTDGKLVIEIKSNAGILPKLKEELEASQLKNAQIELIAFNLKTLAKAKQLMPEYKMLGLLNLDYDWPHWFIWKSPEKITSKINSLNLDGVDVWAGKLLDKNFISSFTNEGLLVYAWTVDNPVKARELIAFGIDGITTNRASWMADQLK